jgi:extradiol dioxygenase family protein
MPRTRHFGATLAWGDWKALVAALPSLIEQPRISYRDTECEQAKAMLADPSGNLIELKAYRQPETVLGSLAMGMQR